MPHVRSRRRLSPEEKAEFWTRWKRGESCRAIAGALHRGPDTFYRVAVRHGGIPPPARRRAPQTLRLEEREEIARAVAAGVSLRAIAQGLGRAPSTISREVQRHGGRGQYRACHADARAWAARVVCPRGREAGGGLVTRTDCGVAPGHERWGPDHAGVARGDLSQSVCAKPGVLQKTLLQHLRRRRVIRRARGASGRGQGRGQILDAVPIRGHELAAHTRFTVATDVQVYFCGPQSPWQRGSNENTNGLLRQYFPKGRDLAPLSQAQLTRIARRLNERPRKTLGFHTPAETLATIVARPIEPTTDYPDSLRRDIGVSDD
jgi:transposase-like protein